MTDRSVTVKNGGRLVIIIINELLGAIVSCACLVYYSLCFTDFRFFRVTNVPFFILCSVIMLFPLIFYVAQFFLRRVFKSLKLTSGFFAVVILLVLLVPIAIAGIAMPVDSYTVDIDNYRKFDSIVDNKTEMENLLPDSIPSDSELLSDGSVKYYYNFCPLALDYGYDIYAEWKLTDDALAEEIERVSFLFEEYASGKSGFKNQRVEKFEKGNYVCYAKYIDGITPFDGYVMDNHSYYYLIFAYNKNDGTVRYIESYCQDTVEESPYFRSLDW